MGYLGLYAQGETGIFRGSSLRYKLHIFGFIPEGTTGYLGVHP